MPCAMAATRCPRWRLCHHISSEVMSVTFVRWLFRPSRGRPASRPPLLSPVNFFTSTSSHTLCVSKLNAKFLPATKKRLTLFWWCWYCPLPTPLTLFLTLSPLVPSALIHRLAAEGRKLLTESLSLLSRAPPQPTNPSRTCFRRRRRLAAAGSASRDEKMVRNIPKWDGGITLRPPAHRPKFRTKEIDDGIQQPTRNAVYAPHAAFSAMRSSRAR